MLYNFYFRIPQFKKSRESRVDLIHELTEDEQTPDQRLTEYAIAELEKLATEAEAGTL